MEVGDQIIHLLVGKATGKGGHHSLTRQNDTLHSLICCRGSAGQSGPGKCGGQVRRDFLESEIVVFVTMRAPRRIQVLPFFLLWGKSGNTMTACQPDAPPERTEDKPEKSPAEASSIRIFTATHSSRSPFG